jgi:hypothetical protein
MFVGRLKLVVLPIMTTKPPMFTYKNYWRPLQQFLGNTDRVSERRWKLVLNFNDAGNNTDEDFCGDESMISAFRGAYSF